MPISADTVRVAFVKQTGTPPITPATPVFTVARITGESVAFVPTTTVSGEFDATGNIRDSILTGGASSGDMSLEVSNHDAFESYLEAVLGGTFTLDVLKNGVEHPVFLLEKTFADIPTVAADSFHRFDKTSFSTLALSIAPGAPITGTVGTIGGELTLGTAIITGATYPDPGIEPVLTPQEVTITVGAIASTACFSALELSFDNGTREIQCIGTLGTKESVRGRLNATINGTLYYATDEILAALIAQDEFAVTVVLADSASVAEYTFEFPRCKLTAAPVVASGTDTDVTIEMSLQALYDDTLACTVQVTRAA